MDLVPSADEEQLAEMAGAFLRGTFPATRLHMADEGRSTPATLAAFAEQGWLAMALPESMGGIGFTVVDECLLFREGGRQLAPPAVLFANLAAKLAAEAGDAELVAELAGGTVAVALALPDPQRGGWRLFEHVGAQFALAAGRGGASLMALSGTDVRPVPCLDKSVTMGHAGTLSPPILQIATPRIGQELSLLVAALLVGIAEAVTDMIVDYAKMRETFGRAIGAYQAVRHPCAEMAVRGFGARAQLFFAAVALRDARADAGLHADAALAIARDAALLNVEANTQLHGGISTTDEHDAHLFLKRAFLLSQLVGIRTTLDRLLATPAAAAA